MKKVQLNKDYYLIRCLSIDTGAMNAFNFDSSDNWVIKKDNGERFATRFTYTTQCAKNSKLYFDCGTSKAAIQQAIIQSFPNEKLKDIYFTIEYKHESEQGNIEVCDLKKGDCIWIERDNEYKEIAKINICGKINIQFQDGTEILFEDNETVLLM